MSIRIASVRQAIRLAELFESGSIVDHYEIANDLQTEPDAIHVKEYRADSSVHNFYIDEEGNSIINGSVGMWEVIPAQSRKD